MARPIGYGPHTDRVGTSMIPSQRDAWGCPSSVSDRGPGIPEDKLKEIFDPFFTSKAEGMGMGLSIARTIIEAHHGQIWAKNRDHGGASFRIKIPLVR